MSKKKSEPEEIKAQSEEVEEITQETGKTFIGTNYLVIGEDNRSETIINLSAIAWAHRFGSKLEITFVGSDVPTPFHFPDFNDDHWEEMFKILGLVGGQISLPGEQPEFDDGQTHG